MDTVNHGLILFGMGISVVNRNADLSTDVVELVSLLIEEKISTNEDDSEEYIRELGIETATEAIRLGSPINETALSNAATTVKKRFESETLTPAPAVVTFAPAPATAHPAAPAPATAHPAAPAPATAHPAAPAPATVAERAIVSEPASRKV